MRLTILILTVLWFVNEHASVAQQSPQVSRTLDGQPANASAGSLPDPSGVFPIGRITFHFKDSTRVEPLSETAANREVMVDVWYPAERSNGPRARYLEADAFEQSIGIAGLRGLLGERPASLVTAGDVHTHAVDRAPFAASLKRVPVLLFSHGSGTVPQIYTAQIEELVSHGYVVAAITHTYDAALTVFPDGRRIPLNRTRRPSAASPDDERLAYRNGRMEWQANDIRFVLNELARQNRMSPESVPFSGRLDLKRVGAFGHSAGGRAAARACQIDRRLLACANQDGTERMLPFYADERGWGMDQPFLFVVRDGSNIPPTDEELRQWGITRAQSDATVGQLWTRRDSTLARTGGGLYWVTLNFSATSHMSFSDLPLLTATNAEDAARHIRALKVLCDYTRSFFDKMLRGTNASILDDGIAGEFVYFVKKYQPARRR